MGKQHEYIYWERDISWLHFNARVLQEAADQTVPLYERLKFLAIYSSNLDEFFRVRVASMRSFRKMRDIKESLNIRPKKILRQIQSIVYEQQQEFGRIFGDEVIPSLREQGIHLINESKFNALQKEFAQAYFKEHLAEHLEPLLLFADDVEIFIENKALHLCVQLDAECEKLALLAIPSTDRFVVFPGHETRHDIAFVDDIIRANIQNVFPANEVHGIYEIKVSRDAELYLGDEFSGDLIKRLEERVQERKKGLPTRFLYDQLMPGDMLKRLRKALNISKYDLIPGARYHNFNDFFGFPDPTNNPVLHDPPLPPQAYAPFKNASPMVDVIRENDQILHFPYQDYMYIPKLIREAAGREDVKSLKITLYRVSGDSAVAKAILYALEQGKEVFAFIEAKARFDEESNLFWGRKIAAAGARVRYSYPGIKVHSKLLQIQFADGDFITYLGTGNFNEKTAKLYADHALLTASSELGVEIARLFETLQGDLIAPRNKKILVSPFTTRRELVRLIEKEMDNARAGKEAWMILKMNSLEDPDMIRKLYEANDAGVDIQLIVRGICCLVPGVEGQSERIAVRSIIDRFLEHARVFVFANDGKRKLYLASADWMTRNLDRRVEIVFPLVDDQVADQVMRIIDLQLSDNSRARWLNREDPVGKPSVNKGDQIVRCQIDTYKIIQQWALLPQD